MYSNIQFISLNMQDTNMYQAEMNSVGKITSGSTDKKV